MSVITVIVPVYKVENYICRCIDSILNQTYTNFDLILIDDGSPDQCGAICDSYSLKDKRITVIHQRNGGLSAARNTGIEWSLANSDSEWITFIDSDDWVHKNYLEFLFRAVIDTKCDISSCTYKSVFTYDQDEDLEYSVEVKDSVDVYTNNNTSIFSFAWGRLYKKEAWKNNRFPVGRNWEDLATTYKLFLSVTKIAYLQADLYFYFQNNEGICLSSWNPGKLDYFWSMELLMNDQLIINNDSLYQIAQKEYLIKTAVYIKEIRNSDNLSDIEKKYYVKSLTSKFIKTIIHGHKNKLMRFNDTKWYYEMVFPKAMRYYWALNTRLKKLWRI